MTAIAPAMPATLPATPSNDTFQVPKDFLDKLSASIATGVADAKLFAGQHGVGEVTLIKDWALLRLGYPPKTDDEDLAFLHKVEASRTPAQTEVAQYWATHGLTTEWEELLKQYTSKVGPAQALQAQKLLSDALMMTNQATQISKASVARKRPFIVDETLKTVIDKPGNNPSFPSGHTTAAYAACEVLAYLMPDRKAEFMGMAQQASWARIYGGVHFPTDVIAGAKLATTITSYLTSHTKAKPKRGTKTPGPGTNPGPVRHPLPTATPAKAVGGGFVALPDAVQLLGEPLAGAAHLVPAA